MSNAVSAWTDVLQQLMPRGRAWSRESTSDLHKLVNSISARYERAENNSHTLLNEMRPEATQQLLPEWEEYLGLPECEATEQSFELRRSAVVEKDRRRGGLQTWQIEQLAAALGFTVKIYEKWPHSVLRGVDYPLYPASTQFVLQVDVYGIPEERFTVLDSVLTPLRGNAPLVLECVLNRLKLAGFYYDFNYEV